MTSPLVSSTGWLTPADIRELWPGAPYDEDTLELLNAAAIIQLQAYAGFPEGWPFYPDPEPDSLPIITAAFRQAQLMQVRNLWNASKTDPATAGYGDEGFVIRPYPLDWIVKALIRPKRAVPVIA